MNLLAFASSARLLRTWAFGLFQILAFPILLTGSQQVLQAQTLSITTQPANQTVMDGTTATFSVGVSGTGPFSYQWSRNGVALSGATSATYTTPTVTMADSGSTFSVSVSALKVAPITSANATLTVIPIAPSISTQPASKTVAAGSSATFSVGVSGTAPFTYQWRKNGVNLPDGTAATYATPALTLADSGSTFSVVVTNPSGSATSANATLTVTAVAPSILTQPASKTAASGTTATFSVAAAGTAPTYQWSRNGSALPGATSASYTTPTLSIADSGATFSVVVSNSAGSVTSSPATLTVNNAPPTITTQPARQSVVSGASATFSVVVAGTAPFSYQWYKGTSIISGATGSSYITPTLTAADNGSAYQVVVSNAYGSVTSATVTLTVNSAPPSPPNPPPRRWGTEPPPRSTWV